MQTTIPELVLMASEPAHFALYAWQNIMVVCWFKHGTGPTMQTVTHMRHEMDRLHPEGVSVIYLIAHGSGLPDADARRAAKNLMERFSDRRACMAVVLYGQGFWVSGMRAVITGVRLLTQRKFAMEIFGCEEELVAWLPERHERHTGVLVDPARLLSVLRHLSAAF